MLGLHHNISMLNAKNWQIFFADFATLRASDRERYISAYWELFFTQFAEFRHIQLPQSRAPLPISDWENFLACFANEHSAYRQQGKAVDIWKLVGLGRDELRNCSILSWLLNCHGSHGQGTVFLQALLLCASSGQKHFDLELVHDYRVTVEEIHEEYEPNNAKQRSRVDIVLEGPTFLLLIEVKVTSGETDNQLERYLRIGRTRAGVRPWCLVYLTLDGRPPKDATLKDELICVRWRDLGYAFLRHTNSMPVASHGTVAIRQFCQHIINL